MSITHESPFYPSTAYDKLYANRGPNNNEDFNGPDVLRFTDFGPGRVYGTTGDLYGHHDGRREFLRSPAKAGYGIWDEDIKRPVKCKEAEAKKPCKPDCGCEEPVKVLHHYHEPSYEARKNEIDCMRPQYRPVTKQLKPVIDQETLDQISILVMDKVQNKVELAAKDVTQNIADQLNKALEKIGAASEAAKKQYVVEDLKGELLVIEKE